MATNLTDYGRNYWVGVLFGVNTVPASYYVALLTGLPDEGYDGTVLADLEPTDTAYARQNVLADGTHWSAPETGALSNLLAIAFPTPTADWGLISHFALCSAATAGEVYAYGEFTDPQYVDADNALTLPIGGVTMSATGPVDSIAD